MAAVSSAASTGIEPGERDGDRENATPTETIESKEIYRGFVALRWRRAAPSDRSGYLIPAKKKESLRPRHPAVGAEAAEWARGKSFRRPETGRANRRQKPLFQVSDRRLLHFRPASLGYVETENHVISNIGWWWTQSRETRLRRNSLRARKRAGNFSILDLFGKS
jgi:hypothetical protein